jgi:hypothetical protein
MGFVIAASTGHEAGEGEEKNLYIPLTDSDDQAAKLKAVSQASRGARNSSQST